MAEDHEFLERYLADIEQYPRLTADDEHRLAQTIEAGRPARGMSKVEISAHSERQELERLAAESVGAERSLVQSHLRMVVTTAREYAAACLPILDVIQEGNLGLLHAVERFDSSQGTFSGFAPPWIRRAIEAAIRQRGSGS